MCKAGRRRRYFLMVFLVLGWFVMGTGYGQSQGKTTKCGDSTAIRATQSVSELMKALQHPPEEWHRPLPHLSHLPDRDVGRVSVGQNELKEITGPDHPLGPAQSMVAESVQQVVPHRATSPMQFPLPPPPIYQVLSEVSNEEVGVRQGAVALAQAVESLPALPIFEQAGETEAPELNDSPCENCAADPDEPAPCEACENAVRDLQDPISKTMQLSNSNDPPSQVAPATVTIGSIQEIDLGQSFRPLKDLVDDFEPSMPANTTNRDPFFGSPSRVDRHWTARNLAHRESYFEDLPLERYGWTAPPCKQAQRSLCEFIKDALMFPGRHALHYCEGKCKLHYVLAWERAGSCAAQLKERAGR